MRLLGVPVGTGLAIAAQSLPLAEVAIGKFAWNFEQSPHLGAKSSWGLGVLTWFRYTFIRIRIAIIAQRNQVKTPKLQLDLAPR